MSVLNGPNEGGWSVFAEHVVEQRDRAEKERDHWKALALRDPSGLSEVTWRDCYEQLAEINQKHMALCAQLRGATAGLTAKIIEWLRVFSDKINDYEHSAACWRSRDCDDAFGKEEVCGACDDTCPTCECLVGMAKERTATIIRLLEVSH